MQKKKFPVAKAALMYVAALVFIGLAIFVPAGTVDYWQGWVFMAEIFVPALFAISYLVLKDPALMERRLQYREKRSEQKKVVKSYTLLFLIGFLVPGLDYRFGWSHIPAEWSIAAGIVMMLGYAIAILAFMENTWASRTIGVEKGQKTISTGPYAIVRHPLYAGQMLMFMALPFALGSWWALLFFLPLWPVMVVRIRDEEALLRQKLPGYREYCGKTRYRLIPFVW